MLYNKKKKYDSPYSYCCALHSIEKRHVPVLEKQCKISVFFPVEGFNSLFYSYPLEYLDLLQGFVFLIPRNLTHMESLRILTIERLI